MRMTEPTRFGKYSKTIRELQEANEALGAIMVQIASEKDAEIARLQKSGFLTKEEIGKRVTETARTVSDGYKQAISEHFMTDAEREANAKCGVAASNTAYFILQALGFSNAEIRALRELASA
jgi:phosphosulfolactate synthase (CoM biosynthesis protein A)